MKFGPMADSRSESRWAEQQEYSSLSVVIQLLTAEVGSGAF